MILLSSSPLTRSNCDVFAYPVAIRNVVHHSPPALRAEVDALGPWTTVMKLSARLQKTSVDGVEQAVLEDIARGLELKEPGDRALAGVDRALEMLLRTGPYALNLIELSPHGVNLGSLKASLDRVLRTQSDRIELVPALIEGDLDPRGASDLKRCAFVRSHLFDRRVPRGVLAARRIWASCGWAARPKAVLLGRVYVDLKSEEDEAPNHQSWAQFGYRDDSFLRDLRRDSSERCGVPMADEGTNEFEINRGRAARLLSKSSTAPVSRRIAQYTSSRRQTNRKEEI